LPQQLASSTPHESRSFGFIESSPLRSAMQINDGYRCFDGGGVRGIFALQVPSY